MTIVYNDGGTLECSMMELCGDHIIADDMYVVQIMDIDFISDDTEV